MEVLAHGLVSSGIVLLAAAALTGFVQARHEAGSAAHTRWRVVHAGGTAGAVQLLALGAVLDRWLPPLAAPWVAFVLIGIAVATWAFFLGPLMQALGAQRAARGLLWLGALLAAPAYLALPLLLFAV